MQEGILAAFLGAAVLPAVAQICEAAFAHSLARDITLMSQYLAILDGDSREVAHARRSLTA